MSQIHFTPLLKIRVLKRRGHDLGQKEFSFDFIVYNASEGHSLLATKIGVSFVKFFFFLMFTQCFGGILSRQLNLSVIIKVISELHSFQFFAI